MNEQEKQESEKKSNPDRIVYAVIMILFFSFGLCMAGSAIIQVFK